MLRMNTAKPETRIPARRNCPICKATNRAALNPELIEKVYEYVCELCGQGIRFTVADQSNVTPISQTLQKRQVA